MQKIKPFIIPVIIIGIRIAVGFLIRKNNAGFTISNAETNNVEANETGNGNTNINEPEENDINILTLRKITALFTLSVFSQTETFTHTLTT